MRHPSRHHRAPTGKTDIDHFERAQLIRAVAWSLPGLFVGFLASAAAVSLGDWSLLPASLLGLAIWGVIFAAPLVAAALGGRAAGTLHNPSGKSTPHKRGHSHAESLVARGLYEEAVAAFEIAISEDPSDPEPYLRIARVLRDHMGRPAEAAQAFKRGLAVEGLPRGTRVLATRELVELYAGKLAQPGRAAPVLARMAEESAGTPEGEWAEEELRRVKAAITGERRD